MGATWVSVMATSVRDASAEAATVVGLVSGSQYVNHAYLVLFPPILGTLSTAFEVSLAMLGVAIGVQGAANTVFQLPFGWLADARDRTIAFALSSVAAGELDAAVSNMSLSPWDTVGGVHLVREAGGTVTDLHGERWTPGADGIIASNGNAHDDLVAAFE